MNGTQDVLHVLQEKYPELHGKKMHINEYGWANQVVVVGDEFIFRFPRTDQAKNALALEQAILPRLGPCLPLPIPDFLYESGAEDEHPHVGYQLLAGQPLTPELFLQLSVQQRSSLAQDLGAFLSALHSFDARSWFPEQASTPYVKDKWQTFYSEIVEKVFPLLRTAEQEWTSRVFSEYLSDAQHFQFKPCLLHADFTSDHLLYDGEKGKLSGVIDFGDMEWGDPAYDFVGLYVEYGEAFVAETLTHYTAPVDATFMQRIAGFYRQRMPFHGILYALEMKQPTTLQAYLSRLRSLIG